MEKPTVKAVNSVPMTAPHLQVLDLTISDVQGRRLLDRVSFASAPGERLAVIGASGAGKSLLALSLMGLLRPPLAVTHGAVWLQGRNLLALPRAERHAQRGTGMFLIFQSPGALLDPMLNIGHQLTQTAARADIAGPEQQKAISRALTDVSLPQTVLQQHAFALSGGMKQRVLIAMALLLKPSLLIADEPTAALDDDTAHEVLNALAFARQATDSMLLLITHDLRLARLYANRVLVLDGGSLVEDATLPTFLSGARSDAGRALLDASAYLRDEP